MGGTETEREAERAPGVAHVLGNPSTADGRDALDRVVAELRTLGHEPVELAADDVDQARRSAVSAVADGAERIVAVGGDGVVHLAVGAVANSDTALGVVAHGTGNDFARALGLAEGDLETQVATAVSEPVRVDALRTTHGWVATVATLGFSGDVTDRANRRSWPRGRQRYTVATLLQLPRLSTYDVELCVDGRRVGQATTLLAVGNTAYFGGGMRICPDADPSDGRLHAVSIGDVPRRTFLRVFPTVFSGRHVRHRVVSVASGTVATIEPGQGVEVDVWGDGERLGPLPVTIELVAGALHVAGATIRAR